MFLFSKLHAPRDNEWDWWVIELVSTQIVCSLVATDDEMFVCNPVRIREFGNTWLWTRNALLIATAYASHQVQVRMHSVLTVACSIADISQVSWCFTNSERCQSAIHFKQNSRRDKITIDNLMPLMPHFFRFWRCNLYCASRRFLRWYLNNRNVG